MSKPISKESLIGELNHFRDVLNNYDFSEISNIVFFDLNSLNHYLKNNEDNPFDRQYREIEHSLSILEPYLPCSLSGEMIEVLMDLLGCYEEDSDLLKEHFVFNIKMDFIEQVKGIENEGEWQYLLQLCEDLRYEKSLE